MGAVAAVAAVAAVGGVDERGCLPLENHDFFAGGVGAGGGAAVGGGAGSLTVSAADI